jgi:phospholipid transport system substrate-binding protein
MIRSSHWRVYDLVFSGVSLIKNYKAQFNSHIKRKGMDSLIEEFLDPDAFIVPCKGLPP